ncbi:P-loop containing nucleoside triphosphate hydrolase protein, partial [Aspergillus aculeatinus CBS 121060]
LSYRVFGFILRSRKWEASGIAYQTQEEKMETAFDQLVLPQGHKEMVESLIAQHFRDKDAARTQAKDDQQFDIVRGKGKGLIILLHGAPGVGKTSTAEGVAEMFRKPLFQITCEDLGTTAREVEQALEMHFTLANRWGCVLLLDEADVFLTARSKTDFIRNGLVSVFLRVLEYYAGVLFLTTNRVGDFDEAFASRIHISLYYPQLNEQSTVAIFRLTLKLIKQRFDSRGRKIDIDEPEIVDYARWFFDNHKEKWNGRQIRNACQTALALAEYRAQGDRSKQVIDVDAAVHLTTQDLVTVSNAYEHFMVYINEVRGADSIRYARLQKLRAQ